MIPNDLDELPDFSEENHSDCCTCGHEKAHHKQLGFCLIVWCGCIHWESEDDELDGGL